MGRKMPALCVCVGETQQDTAGIQTSDDSPAAGRVASLACRLLGSWTPGQIWESEATCRCGILPANFPGNNWYSCSVVASLQDLLR